jgi:sec-independent protein translocase protein TatB
MFDVGPFELLALAVLALFIFGPDKLPKVAADAGRMLRQLRDMARGARDEIGGALGSEFSDLGLKDLDPREFVKRQLMDVDAEVDKNVKDVKSAVNGDGPSSTSSPVEVRDDGEAT